ncbi:MAG: NAD(P)-dependent alcohol dehydrogenase [Bacteroidota bacterium]|nr:NAD(P)-dependent alcohol dehydrogenase [Bacteroidota bacterium]
MKAAVRTKYGSPDVLNIMEVEKPTPNDNEVLIKVLATTVNRTDLGILLGEPLLLRVFYGLFNPKTPITGVDFAGQIESVGKTETTFKIGDRVWGFKRGTHAQYITIAEDKALATIPDNITYEQAAASAEGAHYAYNAVRKVKFKVGQKVLVNGATGAIGSALVQLLKYFGANITAVCDTKNIELVKGLGADKIIDYTKEDFTKDDEKYDFVFDAVGKSSFAKCKPLLQPGGVYTSADGIENLFLALITAITGDKKVKLWIPTDTKKSLLFIRDLLEKEKFKPVIDRKYPLEYIAEAYNYVATGTKTGNVIITFEDGV